MPLWPSLPLAARLCCEVSSGGGEGLAEVSQFSKQQAAAAAGQKNTLGL